MKKLVLLLGAFALIGCGEKKETNDNGTADNGEVAGESVTAETEAPASPESRIIGSWRLDKEKSLMAMDDLPDGEEAEAVRPFVQAMVKDGLRLKFYNDGKVEMYRADDPPLASTYTVITDDKGVISVDVKGQSTLTLIEEVLWSKVGKTVGRIGFTRFDGSTAEPPSENPTAPREEAKPSADSPKPLISDADIERLLEEAVDNDSLQERNGFLYQANESEPYSGWVKYVNDSGQVAGLLRFKGGERHGLFTLWHENDQKMRAGTFKNGKPDGLLTNWHPNGQKKAEETRKNGKQDGPFTWWHENGQKEAEGTYKDGQPYGLMMAWHENGKKGYEVTYKDGIPDGLTTAWHENGQKRTVLTYEDRKLVSVKSWNKNGDEVDPPKAMLEKLRDVESVIESRE